MLAEVRSMVRGEDYGIVTFNCHHVVHLMWANLGGNPGACFGCTVSLIVICSAKIPLWISRLHSMVPHRTLLAHALYMLTSDIGALLL